METKSSKQFEGLATNLWNKYRTDIFFRTTCHIIILQIVLTTVIVIGLWFVIEYIVRDTSQTLISSFAQMLQGQSVSAGNVTENLENIRFDRFWSVMVLTTAVILSFGFIMVYVSLTPTRRSLERQKRFISNIAHELRTPLAIVRTNTDVALLNKDLPLRFSEMLERNIGELDRISEIINNLLSLSNFTRNGRLHFEDVDLSAVVQQALDTLSQTVDDKDVTLTLKTHTNQTVSGNARALEQVAFNLIKNAITYSNKGAVTVEIEPTTDDKYINLSVSDSGSGIARDDLFHIFEPFYRARTTSKKSGRGLGLAIVNEVVQMHRGKIKVKSALGKGTTVIVSIRKSRPETAEEKEHSSDEEEIIMDFSHRILQ